MYNKRIIIVFTMVLLLLCPLTVSARDIDNSRTADITVNLVMQDDKQPITGAEVEVYHVATVVTNAYGTVNYTYTEEFAPCGLPFTDPELALKLNSFLKYTEIEPLTAFSDAQGKAVFTGVPLGVYLIKQSGAVDGFAPFTPFVIQVPARSGSGFEYSVTASPKTDIVRLVPVKVRKVWNTDGSAPVTDSVTVQLLCDGAVVETVVLDKNNDWQHTFTDMPKNDGYSIKEVNVPRGFTATYSQNEFEFTVTNTAALIDTGQLIWPIPVFAAAGLLLLTAGVVILRKAEDADA